MPTYDKAPREVDEIVESIIGKHYPALEEAKVTVGCLQARASINKKGIKTGAALKHHGWPAAAIITINPAKKRAEGLPDATITIDGDQWPTWSDEQRAALIDHELYHLIVARDKHGEIKSDDLGRPKLKMRPHDWQCSGFAEIVKRHGEHSFEVQEAKALQTKYGQLLFEWGEEKESKRTRKARPELAAV